MATRSKPLVSAAALASAAAIAAAYPVMDPNFGVPTPLKLSQAAVQLTTLADVFTIPAVEWTDVLFGNTGWGGTLGPESYGPAFAEPQDAFLQPAYVNPWAANCNNNCFSAGLSGVAYMFFDALINGNGNGYDDYENWNIGIVNYLFEPETTWIIGGGSSPTVQFVNNGFSAATWYALQGTLGQAIPSLTIPIAAAFWGPTNLSVFYNLGLSVVAGVVSLVPGIGPFIGNSIFAYLGDLVIPGSNPPAFYQYGLSGTLNYWVDIATGAVPWPSAAVAAPPAAATVAATTATEEVAAPVGDAKESGSGDSDSAKAAPATSEGTEKSTPAESAPVETPTEGTPAGTTAESTPVESAAEESTAETPAEAPAKVADAVPAESTSDAVADVPAADTTNSAPAEAPVEKPVKAPKRPVRDALDKVSKSIASAIGSAKGAKAAKSGAASDSSDAGSSDSGE